MFGNRNNKAIIDRGKINKGEKRTSSLSSSHKQSLVETGSGSTVNNDIQVKSAASKGGLLNSVRRSFRSKKGNRRKQAHDATVTGTTPNANPTQPLNDRSSSKQQQQDNNNNTSENYKRRTEKSEKRHSTYSESDRTSGYFRAITGCLYSPQQHEHQENGFERLSVKTSTPRPESKDCDTEMGFLKRKTSSKEKDNKKPTKNEDYNSETNPQTMGTSASSSSARSRTSSIDSMKRKLSFRRKKTDDTLNISDAELVFSTYSGSSIDHIEGTLKKRTKSPPPPQMAFYEDAPSSPSMTPSPQLTTAPVLMCESEPIRDEDIHALKDLLKAFSGNN